MEMGVTLSKDVWLSKVVKRGLINALKASFLRGLLLLSLGCCGQKILALGANVSLMYLSRSVLPNGWLE